MRKIRLEVEALEVESFATAGDGAEARGTVRGNSGDSVQLCPKSWDTGCDSLSYVECECVDSEPGQFSCGYYCETRDCP